MENDKPGFFATLKDSIEDYVQDKLLLFKLDATEKVAELVSKLYIIFPLVFIAFIILLLITFLGGYYLSVWLGGYWIGFGIMLVLYVLAFFYLLYLHRSRLKKKVADKIVQSMFQS